MGSVHAGAMYSKRDKRYAYATNSNYGRRNGTTCSVGGPTFPWVDEDNGNPTRNPVYETSSANTAQPCSQLFKL